MLTQNLLIQERNSENDCREAAIFKNSWVFWEHQNTSSPSFIYFFKFVCSVSKDRWRPRLCFMKLVSNRLRKASDGVWKTLRNIKDSDSPRAEYGSLRKVREVNVYVFFFFLGKLWGGNRIRHEKELFSLQCEAFWMRSVFVVNVRTVSVCGGDDRRRYGSAVRTYREESSRPLVNLVGSIFGGRGRRIISRKSCVTFSFVRSRSV